MSSSRNLLQIIFDGIWETGEMIVKSFTKKEVEKPPIEIFFKKVSLCNKDEEYPKLVEEEGDFTYDGYNFKMVQKQLRRV